ncbi:hypothetical protein DV736_g260, partial [Chaetothyriales sp. CBS 134916]
MATASAPPVTIASFKVCSCTQFAGQKEHFAVSTSQPDLYSASAVAISYTWGEFARRKHVLGHWAGDVGRHMNFELGAEWNLTSFVHRLIQLTTTYQAIWIDQACLPQNVSDEEWAAVLMSIPFVFKTLPVIAVFPGRLCRCLTTAYRQYGDAAEGSLNSARSVSYGTSTVVGEAYSRLQDIITGSECIYANGWCSWVDRIWPSVELRYSRQISVCWVEEGFADCRQPGNPDLHPEDLTGPPLMLYRARQSNGASHEDIIAEISMRSRRWIRGIWLAIGQNLRDYSQASSTRSFSLEQRMSEDMARFLLGEVMQFGGLSDALSDLFPFIWACENLAQTTKRATKPHDYIFSVWADWPSYQVPRPFSHLTCFELLADALDQFKFGDYQVFVPSSSPAGLINSSASSSSSAFPPSWKFISNFSKDHMQVIDTLDIYRPFFWLNSIFIVSSVVPLHIEQGATRQSEPRLVREWILELPAAAVLEHVLEFKHRTYKKFIADVVRPGTNHRIYNPGSLLGKQHIDSDDVFDFVCISLNLDTAKCRSANLQAMCVQRQVTTHFGSWRTESANVTCFGLANWIKLDQAKRSGQRIVSVNITHEKWPFYEAVSLPEQDTRFSIAGVWVPLADICECKLECIIDSEGINGILV